MKPTKKPITLTPELLQSLIKEEMKGFGDMEDVEARADDAEETDADELADSLEQHIDFQKANKLKAESATLDEHINLMKALKIEESRLTKRLARVRKALSEGAKKLVVAKVV